MGKKLTGWTGILLRINLTDKKVSKEKICPSLLYNFIGGRGLNCKLLYDEVPANIDPLGPENKVIFGTGPCNGTLSPANGRLVISCKSPLTGFIGDSNGGGSMGVQLKYAGYDVLIIEGQSEKPVYLWINDDQVEIRDASHLWGLTTSRTKYYLTKEVGNPNVSISSIGPAGENLVKYACVINELGNACGRMGIGAVLGSKKVKAVVAVGTKGVTVADNRALETATRKVYETWDNSDSLEAYTFMGGIGKMKSYHDNGILPTMNYKKVCYDDVDCLEGRRIASNYMLEGKSCFACNVPCRHLFTITKGKYMDTYGSGLELGSLEHLTSRLLISDPEFGMKAHALCNDLGIDELEAGQAAGFLMEGLSTGLLDTADTDGFVIDWGDHAKTIELFHMIANREGVGEIFAHGITTAISKIGKPGLEPLALAVKNATISTRDCRGSKAWALGYAVAARGADHCRSLVTCEVALIPGACGFDPENGEMRPGPAIDPFDEKGKGAIVKWYEDVRAFQNLLQICTFNTYRHSTKYRLQDIATELYNAVTGMGISVEEAMEIGERIVNLERLYNLREGLTRADDTLPKRFMEEPAPEGPPKGQTVNLDPMIDEYYAARGWDVKTGVPKEETLKRLKLAWDN